MSAEVIHEFGRGMLGCAQLVKEEIHILDNSVVAAFPVSTEVSPIAEQQDGRLSKELVEGLEEVCITGKRGECPKGHNCGRVKITTSVPPLFIEIEPLEVKGG